MAQKPVRQAQVKNRFEPLNAANDTFSDLQ